MLAIPIFDGRLAVPLSVPIELTLGGGNRQNLVLRESETAIVSGSVRWNDRKPSSNGPSERLVLKWCLCRRITCHHKSATGNFKVARLIVSSQALTSLERPHFDV